MGAVSFILYVGCILWWEWKEALDMLQYLAMPGFPVVHLQFFGFVLVLGLLAQLVWVLLWFSFKWYNELKSKYEPSGETDDYRE